ncbi:MAG: hypothetical protein M0P35_07310 [Bacteroidales bacterium]|jgi:hypothetical protein|nr:hypothetical protein [Bacteroidales bacterium]
MKKKAKKDKYHNNYEYEERAAIYEHYSGFSKTEAEFFAKRHMEWLDFLKKWEYHQQ